MMIISMCHRVVGERLKSKQMVLRIVCRLPFHHHHRRGRRFNAFIVVMLMYLMLAIDSQMGMAVRNGKRSPFFLSSNISTFSIYFLFPFAVCNANRRNVFGVRESWA